MMTLSQRLQLPESQLEHRRRLGRRHALLADQREMDPGNESQGVNPTIRRMFERAFK
jgi:hypothetical protein